MSAFESALVNISKNKDLSQELAAQALAEVLIADEDSISDEEIARFIVGLKEKGEKLDEVVGFLKALTAACDGVVLADDLKEYIDTCGTGGDHQNTFNISTLAGLVVASGGVKVVKHGNVSVTSQSGSADILEALGVNIHLSSEGAAKCVDNLGFAFCFARYFHPSFGRVAKIRREIAERTIFNVLGPLSNPANVGCQIVGVSDSNLLDLISDILTERGIHRALVIHSPSTGIDEISTFGTTQIIEIKEKQKSKYEINPADFKIEIDSLAPLQVGSRQEALLAAHEVIEGKPGPRLNIVALNAGAAFYTASKTSSIQEGYELAQKLLLEGKTAAFLKELAPGSHTYPNHKLAPPQQ